MNSTSLRNVRKMVAPFATKQSLLRLPNRVLQLTTSRSGVMRRLSRVLIRHHVEFLDLGGAIPVEDYLVIHLSPVEVYARPFVTLHSFGAEAQGPDGTYHLVRRTLAAPAIVLNFDITHGLPLADSSLCGINTSHFLEHFSIDQGRYLIEECYRVLRPGGIIRISCPDLRKYAHAYCNGDREFYDSPAIAAHCRYDNLRTLGDRFISKAYDNDNGHKWFYDADSAISLTTNAGFRNAHERQLHQSELPHIAIVEPAYREPESFYIEAVK